MTHSLSETPPRVPYFRPSIGQAEIDAVVECMRSGWLTTGPLTREFQTRFAEQVGAQHAVAISSCTAGLHLAIRALGLQEGEGVLVPAHTFAATAEVVLYEGGVPILVDVEADTLNVDLVDAERKLFLASRNELPVRVSHVAGMIPVHFGGQMVNMDDVNSFASEHGLWVVEDAAHAFPAAYRSAGTGSMIRCGQQTATATCFSFYANKTITTGEGGMVVTGDEQIAERIRSLSLHGLSSNAWRRFEDSAAWDYRIVEMGFKYNLTDIASAIGLKQLDRAEEFRVDREQIARFYYAAFDDVDGIEMPVNPPGRLHAWHLFPIRLRLDKLSVTRNQFCEQLSEHGVGFSVHWRPLHLHPLYESFGWRGEHVQVADQTWPRLISLPIFSGMSQEEMHRVVNVVLKILEQNRSNAPQAAIR